MLGNFYYSNPTKIYFGKDSLACLNKELPKYGERVLLVYGGGSIKKNGIYSDILKILKENNKLVFEDSGVMPNPTMEKLLDGCQKLRECSADLILAVGGGSVVDYAKALSASAYCTDDPWEKFFIKEEPVTNKIIPIGCVLTMVGTGSEMNGGSVITNTEKGLKIGRIFDENLYPKFSILNPCYTMTLPKYQMISGFFDIMSHILEQYFSDADDCTSNYVMEGLLRSLIHSTQIAVENPNDYEARSNIMWTATLALNTMVAKGKTTDWMVHMLGQAIGAVTDATHGMTLAAVSMPYYRHILKHGIHRFKDYALNVWNVDPSGKTDLEIATEGLDKMEAYMNKLGLVMKSSQLGVTEANLEKIADATFISDGGYKVLSREDVINILRESL